MALHTAKTEKKHVHRFYAIARSRDLRFNSHPRLNVVAFLDKALHDDYFCLVASNKQ